MARGLLSRGVMRDGVRREGVTHEVVTTAPTDVNGLLDTFLKRGDDPTDGDALRPRRRSAPPGERRLALELLLGALREAQLPTDCRTRRNARAWLQDASRLMSAAVCFEEFGVDYDAAIDQLKKQWAAGETHKVFRNFDTRKVRVGT
jgi:hypothetical protein